MLGLLLWLAGCRDRPAAEPPPRQTAARSSAPTAVAPAPLVRPVAPAPTGPPAPPGAAAALDPVVERFLGTPWRTLARDRVPAPYRIIVVSQLADYCAGAPLRPEIAVSCLDRLVQLALDRRLSPYGDDDLADAALGEHGLYLSHLARVLAARRGATGGDPGALAPLHRRICRHLAALSAADPFAHAPSYPDQPMRWPADQTVTLSALHQCDRLDASDLADPPTRAWQAQMAERGGSARWPLPRSEMTGRGRGAELPRGSALSFSIRYLAELDPGAARQLWTDYRRALSVDIPGGLAFREWPPGVDLGADAASGPIRLGIGTAASGLALAAARQVGDEDAYRALLAAAAMAESLGGPDVRAARHSILARAIELAASAR